MLHTFPYQVYQSEIGENVTYVLISSLSIRDWKECYIRSHIKFINQRLERMLHTFSYQVYQSEIGENVTYVLISSLSIRHWRECYIRSHIKFINQRLERMLHTLFINQRLERMLHTFSYQVYLSCTKTMLGAPVAEASNRTT